MRRYSAQRRKMVSEFLIKEGIADPEVIRAMSEVPRHLFVEPALAHQAYTSGSLPIGFGQTISHPTTVARMTEALELKGGEKILEIGTGTGYQAAVLAEMGCRVFSIERIPALAERARTILAQLGYHHIAIRVGDGTFGWQQYAPYQRILLTAYASEVAPALLQQLDEGGILVMPEGNREHQKLIKLIRQGDQLVKKELGEAHFVPLISRKQGNRL